MVEQKDFPTIFHNQQIPPLIDWPKLFIKFIRMIIQPIGFTALVFLRRNFGERYLSVPKLIGSAVLLYLIGGLSNSWPVFLLGALFPLLAIWHRVEINLRNKKGVRCHSYYWGDSHHFWRRFAFYEPVGNYRWQIAIEPSFLIIAGIAMSFISFIFGFILVAAALSIITDALLLTYDMRRKVLDSIDGQIEAEQFRNAITQWKDPGLVETEGFVVPPFFAELPVQSKLSYVENVSQLDPALQKLIRESRKAEVSPKAEEAPLEGVYPIETETDDEPPKPRVDSPI